MVTCTLYSCALTSVNGVSAGQQGAPGWGADWLDVVVVQDDAIIRKSVNVWSWDLLRSVETYIIPALSGWI